ncbi:MAG: hypothetical protein JWN26_128 [Candidatus Saccharibacteria bacterium]|nr:hypothetical protein [Candidatus Saccharibacteria bacterium]
MDEDSDDQQQGPRLKAARHAANGLLKSANLNVIPIRINDLCKQVSNDFNLVVEGAGEQVTGKKIDAVTKKMDDGQIFIIYNKDRHVHRMRFSVAHELGHLYMGHMHGNSSIDLGSENFDEIEANQFAAQILMPPSILRADIKSGIKDVDALAEKYQVSNLAMWWHIEKSGMLRLLA